MQEFIEYLESFNKTWTTENSQEIELELDQNVLAFLLNFAEEQGVCLDALVGAILAFQITKCKEQEVA